MPVPVKVAEPAPPAAPAAPPFVAVFDVTPT
jgi:hypothetical protein